MRSFTPAIIDRRGLLASAAVVPSVLFPPLNAQEPTDQPVSEVSITPLDYADVTFNYLDVVAADNTPLRLLLDTGAPTFALQPGTIDTSKLKLEGTSLINNASGETQIATNIYSLPFSPTDCAGFCEFSAYRGLEYYGASTEKLGLDGVINPSQLA